MKRFLTIAMVLIASCNMPTTFINKTLKAEKTGDCSEQLTPTQMDKNIDGEHYEFEYCLKDGFDEKDCNVLQQGDTLLVSFPEPTANDKTALYKLTLDIDAKPQYRYIKLGDKNELMDIGISAN